LPSARKLYPDVEEGARASSYPSAELSGKGAAATAAATPPE